MDTRAFDSLTKRLANRSSRRRVVTGALAGIAASRVGDSALAASRVCRQPLQKCLRNDQCCSGLCVTEGRRSRIRRCQCTPGTTRCGTQCIDLANSFAACNGCDTPCNPEIADACLNGACVCGAGPACTNSEVCIDGNCQLTFKSADCSVAPPDPYGMCVDTVEGGVLGLCGRTAGTTPITCQHSSDCQNTGDPVCDGALYRCDCAVAVHGGGGYMTAQELFGTPAVCFGVTISPDDC